jgi:two-component system response regulator
MKQNDETHKEKPFMNSNYVDILLVEDDANDAELTIRALKQFHLANNLIHLKNGEEALQFIFNPDEKARLPKIILLDIHMPKVDGIEVLQKIKGDARTKSIIVVILTSSNQSPDIKRCYELGANSYIVKPVDFDNFILAIKNLGFFWLLVNQSPT